jgi:hypothetical protein
VATVTFIYVVCHRCSVVLDGVIAGDGMIKSVVAWYFWWMFFLGCEEKSSFMLLSLLP